jgi:hypothetical protein
MKKMILNSKIRIVSKSEASLGNPYVNRVDFVLTDDQPNANGVGIQRGDFIDFANSSLFMPIKMAEGDIEDHPGSSPVGVITQAEIDQDKILGSGVLWPEERPADVALIKDKTEKGEAQISWEVGYKEESIDENGVIWLVGPKLLAATLVKYPAYEGRTPVVSFSSTEDKEDTDMTEEHEEVLETPEDVIEETTPVEEPETIQEEPTEEIVEETPDEVTEPEDVEETSEPEEDVEPSLTEDELQELNDLREYKRKIERSKVVRSTLGDDLEESTVDVLVDLTDKQLEVVKKLVSSRKETKASKEESTLPAYIPTEHKGSDEPAQVLKTYLGGN